MSTGRRMSSADEWITPIFTRQARDYGCFAVRQFDLESDVSLVHDWVSRPYARFWGLVGASVEEVRESYRTIIAPPYSNAYIGLYEGTPAFLMEWYLPVHYELAQYYEVEPGDHGMHILVAPPKEPISGFTWQAFRTVMECLFSDPGCHRVVVEPDVNNEKIHALNRRAGFEYHRVIDLPEKQAYLATCTRAQYARAIAQE